MINCDLKCCYQFKLLQFCPRCIVLVEIVSCVNMRVRACVCMRACVRARARIDVEEISYVVPYI